MRIADLVKDKQGVVTIRSDATVGDLLGLLAEHKIGAVVVSDDDGATVHGIVSERDVCRHLHSTGPAVLDGPVSTIMTSEVRTAAPDSELGQLESTMTEHRIRHVPIVADGTLVAIVSIGDVVKRRIEDLQAERDQLVGYIQQ